jgi:polynucleotide 5'-hydroxyl-kinase GRC3/NOL9
MVKIPNSWQIAIKKILSLPKGLVLLLGGPDTGKTTFFRTLAYEANKNSLKVGLVDADVGQSTIGPPTTIGFLGLPVVKEDISCPQALYFVGDNSPRGHLLETITGTRKMIDAAFERGYRLVIVDTTGMISPPQGEVLKYYKINLISPTHIVTFERGTELNRIISFLIGRKITIFKLNVPDEVPSTSREERAELRRQKFKEFFAEASILDFKLAKLSLFPPRVDLGDERLKNLLVALQDKSWQALSLGSFQGVNRESVKIFTPLEESSKELVTGLVFGSLKVSQQGKELGRISPWQHSISFNSVLRVSRSF